MLRVLGTIARNTKVPPAARVSAAEGILNRAYGRPAQSVAITGAEGGPVEHVHTLDLSELSDEQLRAYELLAASQVDEPEPEGTNE
jgi:hypothetical protein